MAARMTPLQSAALDALDHIADHCKDCAGIHARLYHALTKDGVDVAGLERARLAKERQKWHSDGWGKPDEAKERSRL